MKIGYDDSSIELVKDLDHVDAMDDKFEGSTMVPPISKINTPSLAELLYKIDSRNATPANESKNQPPPKDMEVD